MWSNDELLKLSDVITAIDINQICTTEELEVIGHNSTRLNNLKSEIRVPKHNRNVSFNRLNISLCLLSQKRSQ